MPDITNQNKIKIISIIRFILSSLKFFLKKEYIIFQSSSLFVYNDNTRYLYEYLFKKGQKVFYVTESHQIKKYFDSKKFTYISKSNIFKYILISLKAKIIIDNGDSFFNCMGLITETEVIKISLGHGNGPKAMPTTINNKKNKFDRKTQLQKIHKFDYINFPSKYSKEVFKSIYNLPDHKVINLGYPRNDLLIKKKYLLKTNNIKKKFYIPLLGDHMTTIYLYFK